VVDLQLFLKGWLSGQRRRKNLFWKLIPDGDYGECTIDAVKALQGYLNHNSIRHQHNLTGALLEVDGNFGQDTRRALSRVFNLHFNGVPFFENTRAVVPNTDGEGTHTEVWPPRVNVGPVVTDPIAAAGDEHI
jgi:hypothetical protein